MSSGKELKKFAIDIGTILQLSTKKKYDFVRKNLYKIFEVKSKMISDGEILFPNLYINKKTRSFKNLHPEKHQKSPNF